MTFVAISDTHLHNWSQFAIPTESGINSRLLQILKAIEEAACAADYHAPAGVVPTVYHGGDLFHVRGSLTPSVLNAVLDFFKTIHRDYGVRFRMIAGNHDLETKTHVLWAMQLRRLIRCRLWRLYPKKRCSRTTKSLCCHGAIPWTICVRILRTLKTRSALVLPLSGQQSSTHRLTGLFLAFQTMGSTEKSSPPMASG